MRNNKTATLRAESEGKYYASGNKLSIGKQNFASLRENNCFYIDKSDLIREWWESQYARIMLQNIVKKVRKNVTEADKKRGKM